MDNNVNIIKYTEQCLATGTHTPNNEHWRVDTGSAGNPAQLRDHSGHRGVTGIWPQEQQQGWDLSGTVPVEERGNFLLIYGT